MVLRAVLITVIFVTLVACSNDRTVEQGARIYAQNCLLCHGANLRGGGGAGVEGLGTTPSDLTVLSRRSGGTFPTKEVLSILAGYADGTQPARQMPAFSSLVSDQRKKVKTARGRAKVPQPQAALLAYLISQQRQ